MHQLAANSDYGYGWVIVMALAICLTYAILKRIFPGIARLVLPFPAPSLLIDTPKTPWLIGLVGLGLRVPHLFENLWYDETFTAAFARLPLEKLPAAIMGDVHPPLPTLVQWLTGQVFGLSEVALRLPSLGFGMLVIYLVYRLTLALNLPRKTALLAALLVAVMPAAIYYSNEARGYSLLTCLILAAAICILEGRSRSYILYAGLIPWVHNTAYIYLGLFGVVAILYHHNRRWLKAVIFAGLIGAAWLPGTLQQAGDIANGFWIPPLTVPGSLWYVMADTVGVNMPDLFVLPVYVPLLAVTLLALWHCRRWLTSKRGLFYIALAFGAPALLSLACWVWKPVYVSRALLPSGVALAILWAIYITRHGKNAWWLTGTALMLSVMGFFVTASKEPIESYLTCAPADMAYYTDNVAWFYGNYYLDMPGLVWKDTNDLNQYLSDDIKNVLFRQGTERDLHGNVCLVQIDTPYSKPEERAYVQGLITRYPHHTTYREITGVFHLYIHHLEVS
jgi:hypothetical protein